MLGVLKAVGTVFSAMLRKPVTVQYPTEHRPLPERTRGFPVLLWDFDTDEPYCTGCHACEVSCPTQCMTFILKDNPKFKEGTSKRRKIVDKAFIDYARCMRCNICVEVCNFEAIALDNTWNSIEASRYDRGELVMDVNDLLMLSKSSSIQPFEGTSAKKLSEKVAARRGESA